MTIRVRDLMPMFTALSADGSLVRYEDIWQRKNLVLVTLPENNPTRTAYTASLNVLVDSIARSDTTVVITTTPIDSVPCPGVVVADRWGEVYFVQQAARASKLPSPEELIEWVRYVQIQCPECQGETR
jgi:hypothetical protein